MPNPEVTIGVIVLISVLFWIGTLVAVPLVLIWLPEDYLRSETPVNLMAHKGPPWHYLYRVVKNVFGWIFIAAGMAMLVLPGQGILTIVLGLALIDFPRKRTIIRRIFTHHRVFNTINRLRARARKPPLQRPEPESPGN